MSLLNMPLAESDPLVEKFSAQRPDHPFRTGVLP